MSLRRISEDAKLRPFLSAHFDKQNFIKNLIKDGKSEKYLSDISLCIEDINIEIKDYISKHTDTLMSGMQDFALLANRYSSLSSSSQILHKKVDRLKADTLEIHDVIQLRTNELERIHNSSISLRLLRQFVVAKSQLDHQFKNLSLDSFDTRLLASAAKLLFEVEMLIRNDHVKEIDCVKSYVSYLKDLGQQLRRKSQEKLLSALKEKNQASVANCLQIFFNLQSLPEVILLAIDVTVKSSIDISKALIDIDEIQKQYNVAPQSAVKKGSKLVAQSTVNLNQSKLIMKEISHSWATAIYEQANQILVLQKVLLKKEDPSSHVRFIDVVGHINDGADSSHYEKANVKNSHSNLLLSKGDLISLFWTRFSFSLQDVSIEKLKYNPTVAIHLYPYLRKSGLEAYESLEKLLFQNDTNVFLSSNQTTLVTSGDSSLIQTYAHDNLGASYDELFLSLGFKSKDNKDSLVSETNRNMPAKKTDEFDGEKGFILGLKPLKDRYLMETLLKVNQPVLQMFPSTEGYSSAVPSKRDLQAWIKVITSEIVSASFESDLTLVMSVCRESVKSIELLLTKIEDMVYNGNEIKKILQNQNIFIKNSHQDHNTQLLVLLTSLKDELERLPNHIVKIVQDIPGGFSFDTSFTRDDVDRKKSASESLRFLLNRFVYFINKKIDLLVKQQLLLPIVESVTAYCKSQLQSLLKEPVSSHVNVNSSSSNSSKTVQLFVRQLPDIFRVYLFSLPSSALVSSALKEMMERIMCMFISYSSLRRPMTESYKLQITTDCNLLEETLLSLGYQASGNSISGVNNNIVLEFKSFQHLLFEDFLSDSLENRISNEMSSPPSKEKIFGLNHIGNFRPSTLLSFLFSSAPSLLPMPSDISPSNVNFLDYLLTLSKSTNQIIIKENFEDALNYNNLEDNISDDSEGVFPESYILLYSSAHNWKSLESQQKCWLMFQECLDVFIQRLSVSDDANQRNLMRKWYEVVLLVGGQYFGVCEPTV